MFCTTIKFIRVFLWVNWMRNIADIARNYIVVGAVALGAYFGSMDVARAGEPTVITNDFILTISTGTNIDPAKHTTNLVNLIKFPTQNGIVYTVQLNTNNLAPDKWKSLPIIVGDGLTNTITSPRDSNRMFYKAFYTTSSN